MQQIFADDFQLLTGETSYDVDFPANAEKGAELMLRLSSDEPVQVYLVGTSTVVPVYFGTDYRYEGKIKGFYCLQIVAKKKAVTIAINCKVATIRDGQRIDPTRVVVPVQPDHDHMTMAIRAMVRAQLRQLGYSTDGDVRDFADGNMEFDDDDEGFQSDYEEYEDEPPEREREEPAGSPAPAPEPEPTPKPEGQPKPEASE